MQGNLPKTLLQAIITQWELELLAVLCPMLQSPCKPTEENTTSLDITK